MAKEPNEPEDFIAILRGQGLQVTHQRLAIYQELYHSKEHPDAEMIYRAVKKRFPMISLGTVYKTLERFSDIGLAQKVSPTTEVARYDADVSPHHHVVCLECQRIQDLMDPSLGQGIKFPENTGFDIVRYKLFFQGYCSECKKHKN